MTKKFSSKRRKVVNTGCTSSEFSPAGEVISGSVDLLTEILLRFPARSLLRFKCVSKEWQSLISDPQFSHNHSRRSCRSSVSGLYFYLRLWYDHEEKTVSLHDNQNLPTLAFLRNQSEFDTKITHACNGLMLSSLEYTGFYSVLNMTTQKYTVLPKPALTYCGPSPSAAYLAFDPSKSPHYKVVAISGGCRVDIYSSESGCWKQITMSAPKYFDCTGGVFWNGAIHWLNNQDVLVRFDINAEKLIEMPNPPRPKVLSLKKTRYFGDCQGHLILIQLRLNSAKGFRILEMEKDYSGWIVKCRVNLRPLISVFPEVFRIGRGRKFHVLSVVKETDERDFTLVLAIDHKVVSYNQWVNKVTVLRDLPPDNFSLPSCFYEYSYQFIESLSPV